MPTDAKPLQPDDKPPVHDATRPPGVLTELLCERCGSLNLIKVKGCWYCETCHHKFDCYGW